MKTLVIFALMTLAVADSEFYDLEKVDIADLEANLEEFKKFNDCLINKGPCNELYTSYKVLIRESTVQACRKCTVELKQFAYHYFDILKTNFPEDYASFKQIYDPENKYIEALETELNKYKTE